MRVPIQCGSCLHFNHSKPSFKLRHWFPSLKVVTSWIQNHDASEHNSRYWSLLSLVVRIKLQSRQYLQFPSCDCESCNGNDPKERNSKWCRIYMKCGRIPQKIMCKYVRASTSMCIQIFDLASRAACNRNPPLYTFRGLWPTTKPNTALCHTFM